MFNANCTSAPSCVGLYQGGVYDNFGRLQLHLDRGVECTGKNTRKSELEPQAFPSPFHSQEIQFPMMATRLTSRESQRKIPIPKCIHKSYRRRYQMTRITRIPYSNLQKEASKRKKKDTSEKRRETTRAHSGKHKINNLDYTKYPISIKVGKSEKQNERRVEEEE